MNSEMLCHAKLRDIALEMLSDGGWPDLDVQTLEYAADMLEFFFGQMQMHSPKMDGQHSYRFRGGWPMQHCVGPNKEAAVLRAADEAKRARDDA